MWVQRVGQLVRSHNGPLLIEENLYGISEIAQSLIARDGRVLWIEFDNPDLGELRTVGWGVPDAQYIERLVDALRKHREIIHPTVQPIVVLTRAESAIEEISSVLADDGNGHHVVVSGSAEAIRTLVVRHPECKVLSASDLRISSVEAETMISRRQIADDWVDLLDADAVVSYEEFKRVAYGRLGLNMPDRPTPRDHNDFPACLTQSQIGLIGLLSRNRQWKRALDVAIAKNSTELLGFIDLIGEDALLHDDMDSFRRKLMHLPPGTRNAAEILYWRLIADCMLGLESEALTMSIQFLTTGRCPRLHMLLTTLGAVDGTPIPDSPHPEDSDPMLVVYRAHLRSFDGSNVDSAPLLRQMIEVFRNAGRDYRLVQSMTILANSLILSGNFQEAAYWGLEARRLALELNMREYEVTYVTGPVAYALIMSGDSQAAGEILSQVQHAEKFAGRPFVEGIISTIADHFAIAGHFDTALKWYEIVRDKYRGPASNIVMPDVCLMLVRLGRSGEALRLVKAKLMESSSDAMSLPFLELAHGLALLDTDSAGAVTRLKKVLRMEPHVLAAPFRIRAALMVALHSDRNGFSESAIETLDSLGPILTEVGVTGWLLLSGKDPNALELRNRWLDSRSHLEIEFLVGRGNWSFRGSNSAAIHSTRLKELIFVLSWFPDGVRGEYIQELLGWDNLANHTVRRHMHRLRKHVPVDGRPYRLGVNVKADYLCLVKAIEQENLIEALMLFAGPLLRDSDAPFVLEKRASIEKQLRSLVLSQGTPEQIAEFALKLEDDIELLECALSALTVNSPISRRVEALIVAIKNTLDS